MNFFKQIFTGVFASIVYASLAGLLSFLATSTKVQQYIPANEIIGWVPWLIFISSYLFLLKYKDIKNLRQPTSKDEVQKNYRYTLWWGFGLAFIHYVAIFRSTIVINGSDLTQYFYLNEFFQKLDAINSHLLPLGSATYLIGFIVAYYGLFVAITARMYLNGYWNVHINVKPRIIMTDGPYARCRHPIYTGQMIMAAGTAILSQEILAYAFLAWVIAINKGRAENEEDHYLRSEKKTEYENYMKITQKKYRILMFHMES